MIKSPRSFLLLSKRLLKSVFVMMVY